MNLLGSTLSESKEEIYTTYGCLACNRRVTQTGANPRYVAVIYPEAPPPRKPWARKNWPQTIDRPEAA